MYRPRSAAIVAILVSLAAIAFGQEAPPGVVVDRSPDPERVYIGCPSIAVLPSGEYVASHSWFGPGTTNNTSVVFASADQGKTWRKRAEIVGQWWSTLFLHKGALYIMGVDGRYGRTVIRRSTDGGATWTSPKDGTSGLLLPEAKYHTAPVPVVVHQGRIWRAFEERCTDKWASGFCAFVMSAPAEADLLHASNWTVSNRLPWGDWEGYGGWLEGNLVVTPDDTLVNILRVHEPERGGKAAILEISEDGTTLSADPETLFIDFPGGCKKFTIRYDPVSKRYWSLTNWAQEKDRAKARDANMHREVRAIILYHPDVQDTGFQYADWLFEGDDLIVVSRTAFYNAHNCHDANFLTFHRIEDFREKERDDTDKGNTEDADAK